MKILFVSAVLPYPLYSGGQIRIYQLLKRLSKRHEVTLVSFIRDSGEREYRSALDFCEKVIMVKRGYAWQPKYVFRALTSSYPFLMATYDNAKVRAVIAHLLAKHSYGLIHLEPFYVWPSVPKTRVPVLVSEHNIEYSVYERYKDTFTPSLFRPFLSWDVGKLFRWERHVWRNAAEVTAVSATDARTIETYLSHDISVVPNGVDLTMFRYEKPGEISRKRAVFVGNFLWLPNREAASELVCRIWPAILNVHPDAHLTVAGRHIPTDLKEKIRALGAVAIEDAPDITAVYHDADVLIAPHGIAGGTKYKMLEAMASGLPIVTSPQGMAGLMAESDVHFLEARTAGEFVAAVGEIWDNTATRMRVARAARHLVESIYNWDTIATTLDRVWKKTSARKRHP